MTKMFNPIAELLPEMIDCFKEHRMFERLEEGDIISCLPFEDSEEGQSFVNQTNVLLADFFGVEDGELCYPLDSYLDKLDNPIFFWKDYLNCFFDLELVDDDSLNQQYLGTAYGMYRILRVIYIDDVNRRLKKRRLNGIRIEYKVKSNPMDRNKHWNRSYDKDF